MAGTPIDHTRINLYIARRCQACGVALAEDEGTHVEGLIVCEHLNCICIAREKAAKHQVLATIANIANQEGMYD